MNTQEMAKIALRLAELDELPIDSGIQVEKENVKKVLAGIDISSAEVLAAYQLGYDCVALHHNLDNKIVKLGELIEKDHMELLVSNGVPINIAQKIMEGQKKKVCHQYHPANFDASVQMARLLGIGYIGLHTPADLLAQRYIQNRIDALYAANPRITVKHIIDNLKEIREFSSTEQGPEIFVGSPESYTGKTLCIMAGGLAPLYEEFEALIHAGYGTFVLMHLAEDIEKKLTENKRCNVIVAGHMASDSLGFNQILDAWEKEGGIKIDRVGGIV